MKSSGKDLIRNLPTVSAVEVMTSHSCKVDIRAVDEQMQLACEGTHGNEEAQLDGTESTH